MNLLNLNKITFSYDEISTGNPFLLNISEFRLESGESLAVTGSSGAGKTTFAKLLATILKPSSGEYQVLQKGMKISMSFQFPENQFYLDTVLDDIVAGLLARGINEKEAISAANKALEMVNLKPSIFGKRNHTTLSGGEKRRAAIAILFSLQPDLYIIDEPTAGLDGIEVQNLSNIFNRLSDEGKTVIIMSQDSTFIAETCQRIVLLDRGSIVSDDSVFDFFNNRELTKKYGIEVPPSAKFIMSSEFSNLRKKSKSLRLKDIMDLVAANDISKDNILTA